MQSTIERLVEVAAADYRLASERKTAADRVRFILDAIAADFADESVLDVVETWTREMRAELATS